jgi:hypothetical protein
VRHGHEVFGTSPNFYEISISFKFINKIFQKRDLKNSF